ncbi:PREDICTED: E3 ubiquitin-protein ligase RAD18-like isoform X2 [Vollenhovia emeryi]|uniref:E3 ubiquitin-protein ligase RAD18-like isoform X2 n=1 Tax=Vollenhovia emeryi TaxID=411798 RepID=UPI0005F58CF3|nr:PREDICTED: E3 ubiquitin-protein ligase RAD18-like isoform X2 [Vollenhovia emeryi]
MWPREPELKRIDELLHCGICYEYMDTSVITSCSHSYCSLCIRKYLHYKTQCPICYEETFEKDLRKNKLLDEIIIQYLNFKEKHDKRFHRETLLTAKDDNSETVCSVDNFECKKEQDVLDAIEVSHKSFDSPTLAAGNVTPRGRKDHQQDVSTPSTSADLRIPLMFTPKSKRGVQKEEDCQIVTCPVCKVGVFQSKINRHLDDCLKRESANDQPKKSEPKRKPLPKLVLNLMKDNVIRKRLKELGLFSQGDRKALENRLQRYTILYNAECDKTYPRPVAELIKQCEEEENFEKKVQKPLNRLNVNRNTEHNVIEQQRKKYLTTNKDSFDQLIARIKYDNGPQKISVRRNILNKKHSDNDCVMENDSTIKDRQKTHFLPLISTTNCIEDSDKDRQKTHFLPLISTTNCIEDLDLNTSCPLQTYFNENPNPINFLSVELNSSSDDSTDQCASNHNILNYPCKTSPDSFSCTRKMESVKVEKLSPENILIHEEITNRSSQCDVSESKIDIDTKRSVSEVETENGEQTKLSKRDRSGPKTNLDKYVTCSEPKDRSQIELYNESVDIIVEDIDHIVEDSDIDNQEDYERSKHEQLNKAMEDYVSGSTKFEKENLKALDQDLTTRIFRKREREIAFALNDVEIIADRAMNTKKLPRFGLSEAKGFNNENPGETVQDEEKSQSEKEQSQTIRINNVRNLARKSVRLRNKISNKGKKISNMS